MENKVDNNMEGKLKTGATRRFIGKIANMDPPHAVGDAMYFP